MTLFLIALFCGLSCAAVRAEDYRAGLARVVLTPNEPMWLAGYASRNRPAEGKVHDLHAKALALEDSYGKRIVIVTMDLIGIPKAIGDAAADEISRRLGLSRADICLSTSHTHTGPAFRDSLYHIYSIGPEEQAKGERYAKWLQNKIVEVAAEAMSKLEPVRLSHAIGRAGFAVNRRNNVEAETSKTGFIALGPVDHDVPVLRIADKTGTLKAVLFGYACHCTTLNFYKYSGDYAGFAQINLEKTHPGATAMFFAGCGADINPLPRRKLELCIKYGRQLSDAVEQVLADKMKPISGPIKTVFKRIDIPFEEVPTRAELEAKRAKTKLDYVKRAIDMLLAQIDAGKPLPADYPYPLQVIKLGSGPTMVIMGGEAVVDYSLRFKKELGPERTWMFAYANDVCAYIPSLRVLLEGGYEGDTSMLIYGHAAKWSPPIEEMIVSTVHELVRQISGERVNILACRLANYGKFKDAAWSHLPSIGVRYIFMNVPPPDQVKDIQKRLAEHGLSVAVLRGDTRLSRESCVDELAEQLETCEKMGVKYMFLSVKHDGIDKKIVYERLRQAGYIAKKHGVTIALETHPEFGTNGDVHLETMKQVNHPNIRVNFDTANIHYYNKGTDAPTELKKIIDYVATVELKDHNGQYKTWNFPALGKGVVNIPEVLKILKEHNYAGPLTIEVEGIKGRPWNQAEAMQAVSESVIYVKSLGKFR